MDLSNYKRWRVLLHRVIVKQQAKWEQTHPVFLPAVYNQENVENVNMQNDYKTTSKKWTDKKKTDLFCVL